MGGIVSPGHASEGRDYDVTVCKVILVGDEGVGKSCLLEKLVNKQFLKDYIPTIGVEFKRFVVPLDDKAVLVQAWDTGGQERFQKICTSYYIGADGVMIIYDATNEKSFENVDMWLRLIKKHGSRSLKVMLVGNHCDEVDKKVVDYSTAKDYADSKGLLLIEASAKDDTNVEFAFVTLATQMLQTRLSYQYYKITSVCVCVCVCVRVCVFKLHS